MYTAVLPLLAVDSGPDATSQHITSALAMYGQCAAATLLILATPRVRGPVRRHARAPRARTTCFFFSLPRLIIITCNNVRDDGRDDDDDEKTARPSPAGAASCVCLFTTGPSTCDKKMEKTRNWLNTTS